MIRKFLQWAIWGHVPMSDTCSLDKSVNRHNLDETTWKFPQWNFQLQYGLFSGYFTLWFFNHPRFRWKNIKKLKSWHLYPNWIIMSGPILRRMITDVSHSRGVVHLCPKVKRYSRTGIPANEHTAKELHW